MAKSRVIIATTLGGILALVVVTFLGHTISGWRGGPYSMLIVGLNAAITVVYAAMGLLLLRRRRGGAIAPLLLLIGVVFALAGVLDMYLADVFFGVRPWRVPFSDAAGLAHAASRFPVAFATSAAMLLFPTGRLLWPRWRWVMLLGLVAALLGVAALTFGMPSFRPVYPMLHSPFRISGFPRRELETVADIGAQAFRIVAVTSIVIRWRRGDRVVRAQTTLVLVVIALTVITMAIEQLTARVYDWANAWANVTGTVVFLLLAVAMAVAIVRYRLFDIERIVSRTIAYTAVTGILAVTFGVASLVIGTLLGSVAQGETIAIAGATLVSAAAFSTVRRRAQRVVERRFDRARYDAALALDRLSTRLQLEVDIDRIEGDILGIVDETVHPLSRTIWLRPAAVRGRST
jgi:hypothetical protein